MAPAPFSLPSTLRRLALAALLCAAVPAFADDYAEVSRLIRSGQLAQALAGADQSLAARPADPRMRFLRGVIQTEARRPAEALETFTRLTQDYPELPEPYNNLAVLHAGQGRLDQARAALEMAVRVRPDYAVAHENLGDVYARLAGQSYARALALDAGNKDLPPKLALIRELVAAGARGARPVTP